MIAPAAESNHSKKTLKTRLQAQRKEFENVVKRHLAFIDTLLSEKNELSKKCETLTDETRAMEKSFKEKIKMQEDQHLHSVKQQRELWSASEKIKRDKWIAEKTKSIKDQTVKGLEPEIQRMIAQHKIQLRQVEEKFKEDLIREKRQIVDSSQQQLEQMREKMIAERQKACEDEREFGRHRYQKQLERDEMEFQQQKRKLLADHANQQQHLQETFHQTRAADQLQHKKELDALRAEREKAQSDAAGVLESVKRKHAQEMQEMRERLVVEKEEWQDRVVRKQEVEIRAWEKQLKEKLLQERDAELELIVERLECETNSSSGDIHKRYQLQIEKLKSDMSDETKQLQEKHNIALDRVLEAQTQLQVVEEQKRDLQKKLLHAQHESMSKQQQQQQPRVLAVTPRQSPLLPPARAGVFVSSSNRSSVSEAAVSDAVVVSPASEQPSYVSPTTTDLGPADELDDLIREIDVALRRDTGDENTGTSDDDEGEEMEEREGGETRYEDRVEECKSLVGLLYHISEDQARRDGFVHRGVTCNHCSSQPIRGIRYHCLNCPDYDLCESCENLQDAHMTTHAFAKIRIPLPPHCSFRGGGAPVMYPGLEIPGWNREKEVEKVVKGSHFEQIELEALFTQFHSLATIPPSDSTPGGISRETFDLCLGALGRERNLITDRIFAFFDADADGVISFAEFVRGLGVMIKGSLDERIEAAFNGYDLTSSNTITRASLHKMFKSYFYLSMQLVRDYVKTVEQDMMDGFDDEAAKPVSASFTAPIPSSGGEPAGAGGGKDRRGSSESETSGRWRFGAESPSGRNHGAASAGLTINVRAQVPASGTKVVTIRESEGRASGTEGGAPAPPLLETSMTQTPVRTVRSTSPTWSDRGGLESPIFSATGYAFPPLGRRPSSSLVTPTTGNAGGGGLTRGSRAMQEVQALRRRSNASLRSVYRDERGGGSNSSTTSVTFAETPAVLHSPTSPFEELLWSAGGAGGEEMPGIEAMSQDAIEEMVERTFLAAGAVHPDFITLDEFRKAVEVDNSYLQWFEALGSVF
ncbi:hypothetical protein HDU98_008542 [Podochytrium sp. JEL0797]|nr:hypothetical protein HDU98_008542 [Podochytrium sp. JEL0797]